MSCCLKFRVAWISGQRRGRVYLHRFDPESQGSSLVFTLETAAIFDMKWCPDLISAEKILLAVVDAAGTLTVYQLQDSDEATILAKVSTLQICPDGEDALACSLDFSSRRTPDQSPMISVSDSKGRITLVRMTEAGACLETQLVQASHGFEAWITAFDAWNPKIVFSGGDDSKLRGFCLDGNSAYPIFTIGKEHMAGVTSLLSDVYLEHRLYSGR